MSPFLGSASGKLLLACACQNGMLKSKQQGLFEKIRIASAGEA
jgi:hypothetical protein